MKWAIQGYPTIFRKFAVTVPNNQRHDRVTINTYLTYADVSIYAKDKEKYNGILHYRWYRQPKQVQVNPMSFVTVGTLKNGSKLYRAIPISDRSQYVYFSQYYGGECKSIPIKPKPIITIEPPITVYPISPNQIKPPIPTPVPMLCAVSTILYGLDKSTTIDEVYLSSEKPESVKEYDKIVLSIIPEK